MALNEKNLNTTLGDFEFGALNQGKISFGFWNLLWIYA